MTWRQYFLPPQKQLAMAAIRRLLLIALLATVIPMNLTRKQKQSHVKRVALATAMALQGIVQSSSAASTSAAASFVTLLRNKRIKKGRNPTTPVERPTWSALVDDLSDVEFRKIFRMPRDVFYEVCDKVKDNVGVDNFVPESHVKQLEESGDKVALMAKKKGGLISGEAKLGITLRLLAGGSYLDNRLSFKVKFSSQYKILHDVCEKWLDHDSIFPFVLKEMVEGDDVESMKTLSDQFSMRASDGHFAGCIGAMDGIALKIGCPQLVRDEVPNPGDYYCHKGFYALNMQAIFDPFKRFLWLSSGHIGSCPDARAFPDTELHKLFLLKAETLRQHGYFLVGDSGYFLRSFLMTPFAKAASKSDRDNFNYYLSNCRIVSECAFGEFILHWGIFWKCMEFKIQSTQTIINACARLHNLIVTRRDNLEEPGLSSSPAQANGEMSDFSHDFFDRVSQGGGEGESAGEAPFPSATDNGESVGGGRPTLEETVLRKAGAVLRESLCQCLALHGLERKSKKEPVMNEFGHVYYK